MINIRKSLVFPLLFLISIHGILFFVFSSYVEKTGSTTVDKIINTHSQIGIYLEQNNLETEESNNLVYFSDIRLTAAETDKIEGRLQRVGSQPYLQVISLGINESIIIWALDFKTGNIIFPVIRASRVPMERAIKIKTGTGDFDCTSNRLFKQCYAIEIPEGATYSLELKLGKLHMIWTLLFILTLVFLKLFKDQTRDLELTTNQIPNKAQPGTAIELSIENVNFLKKNHPHSNDVKNWPESSNDTAMNDLTLLVQNTPFGMIIFDKHQNPLIANAIAESLFELPVERMQFDQLQNFLVENQSLQSYWQSTLNGQTVTDIKCSAGQSSHFNLSFIALESSVALIIENHSEQIQLERQLLDADTRWKYAVDEHNQGLWDWNVANNHLYFSGTWINQVGYKRNDLRPEIGQWYALVHPKNRKRVRQAALDHYNGLTDVLDVEFQLKHLNGSYIWFHARGKAVTRTESGEPIRVIGTMADISEDKIKEAKIEYLAYHDHLTALPNRKRLKEAVTIRLAIAKRYEQHGAMLHLDLDGFKLVNDSLGHHNGDLLLKKIAERLEGCIRSGDLLVRLGGDEFAVLLGQQCDDRREIANHALNLSRKILDSISYSVDIDGQAITSGASIGIAIFPNDGSNYDELLKHSDAAMYRAKEKGRNGFHFYENELEADLQRKLSLQNRLRTAIHNNELVLYYQPKVRVSDGKIIGAEALVRWQSENRMIPPDEFIQTAEETGLIVPLGDWVLNNAIEQMSIWAEDDCFSELDHIAINVSPQQIEDPLLPNRIRLFLNRCPELAEKIEIEMTESAFIQNPETAKKRLLQIKNLGLRLAIDDFGTGYSALSYLKDLPFDVLKIDRVFINDINKSEKEPALTNAIISMGKALNLDIVAEGVENQGQLDYLKKYDCDYIQGYFYSPPIPADQFWKLFTDSIETKQSYSQI